MPRGEPSSSYIFRPQFPNARSCRQTQRAFFVVGNARLRLGVFDGHGSGCGGVFVGGGEGFFENSLEELRGVSAGVLNFCLHCTTGRHQHLNPLHDRGLLGDWWEGDQDVREVRQTDIRLPSPLVCDRLNFWLLTSHQQQDEILTG